MTGHVSPFPLFASPGALRRWRWPGAGAGAVLVPHVVFALCLIVPFVVLCAFIGSHWVQTEQVRSDARVAELADGIADELDRFLRDRIMVLQTLAASPDLDRRDTGAIEAQAKALLADGAVGLLMRDRAGGILLNTLARSGTAPTDEDLSTLPPPTAQAGPVVSDLLGGVGGRPPALVVEVPVLRGGVLKGTLGAVLRPSAFDALFASNSVVGDLMGSIVDRTGRVVARSAASHAWVGSELRGFAGRTGPRGLWFGPSMEGVTLRVAYRRLPETGLLVNVGMTQSAFAAPLKRTLWTLGGLALALVLGAFALSLPLLRRMLAAHRSLAETAELLSLAQEAAGGALWDWDIEGRRISLAPRNARMHGLTVSEGTGRTVVLTLEEWEGRVFPDDLAEVWVEVDRAIATRTTFNAEFRTRVPGGARGFQWVQSLGRVVYDEAGRPRRLIGLHFDVTARRETEEALREGAVRLQASEERLTLALDSGEDGLFDWDLGSDEIWLSERWRAKLGYGASVPRLAQDWAGSVHPDDLAAYTAAVRAHLDGHTPCLEVEYRRICADGRSLWILARGRASGRGPDGRPLRMVGTLIDITHRKEAEMAVAHMALHDALTNLPNRNLFNRHLQEALGEAAVSSARYAVLACDLDRFKAVNDTFGHPAGDRLLCLVADRIRDVIRGRDCVARLGGDEFAVILNDVAEEAAARRACERIIAAIGEPILLDGNAIHIGISIGVAFGSAESLSGEQVFRRADTALYEAKAAGRNTYRLYEAETHARVATRSLIALDMKEAIRRGDFSLVYQPVIDTTTNRVASFEALMRWNHPERGPVSPGEFIPVAEETGLIVPLGAWALHEACREAMRWPAEIRIGVNVSAVQFDANLEATVVAALAGSGLPAGRLKLEVTESLLMRNPDQAFAALHRLRGLGARIALDDFGTGYSSLSYLRRFPFDKLKIDRAFVKDIADPDAAAIVRAVVGIGERLGMGVVAEGVETPEQLDIVRREGCTEVQGFLFSRPLPPDEALAFVLARRAREAA